MTRRELGRTGASFFSTSIALGAHRGGKGLWPENTLAAFTNAVQRWPHVLVETDTRITADGHVVLLHDPTVDRTTNGTGPVSEMTLEELRRLDAAHHFTTDDGSSFPYRGTGVQIPSLRELFEAIPDTLILIELKDQEGIADAVVEEILKADASDRVLLASFEPRHMKRAQELAPELPSCFNYETGMTLLNHVLNGTLDGYEPENDVIALDMKMITEYGLTSEIWKAVKSKGLLVQIHTINDRDTMIELLDQGVDCILSDRPDILHEVLSLRK